MNKRENFLLLCTFSRESNTSGRRYMSNDDRSTFFKIKKQRYVPPPPTEKESWRDVELGVKLLFLCET